MEPEIPRAPSSASPSSREGAAEAPAPWLKVGCWATASGRSRFYTARARGPTTTAVPKEPLRLGIEVRESVFPVRDRGDKYLLLRRESIL